MEELGDEMQLNIAERIFLHLWCKTPPPKPYEPRDDIGSTNLPPMDDDPLGRTRRVYGHRFEDALKGKVLLDIGCGVGNQVLAAAQTGANLAVGVDTAEVNLRIGEKNAVRHGLHDRVRFTTDTIPAFGKEWADVVLSQNSFEHFDNPQQILAQAYDALKPRGLFFLTFGPMWWHPFGVHHMFMIKRPWAHIVFSEKTILRVRQLYRPNKPKCWKDVLLNQMTIKKLLKLVEDSRFSLVDLCVTPIKPLPQWLVNKRIFREWTSSDVSVILTKT